MFDWLTYEHIKDFQGLIVGAFGFGGVIWTLRQNARLTRQQHERGIQHERALITRALLAELRRNRDNFADNLKSLATKPAGAGINMPRRTISEIYDKNFDRIAHLHEAELKDVLDAYSKIKAIPNRIMFVQLTKLNSDEIVENDLYIQVDPRFVETYKILLENAFEAANKAIQTLGAK